MGRNLLSARIEMDSRYGKMHGYHRSHIRSRKKACDPCIELLTGVENEVVNRSDINDYWPDLVTHDIVGGIYLPNDGQTNPVDTTLASARGARNQGALMGELAGWERPRHQA